MAKKLMYDHIFVVTSLIQYDRRMERICSSLSDEANVLLIGRGDVSDDKPYDKLSYQCRVSSGPLFYLELVVRLILILKRYQWHTLTCVDLDTILVGRWYLLFRRFKYVYDAHEYFTEVPELIGRPLRQKIWRAVGRFCIPATHRRYTVSDVLAKEMESIYGRQFDVIRNLPVYRPLAHFNKREDKLIVIYLGVLNKGRGLAEMMKAMDELDSLELWIVGGGDIENDLMQLHQRLKYPDRIKFLGMLSEEEFSPLLAQAHIGINLLVSESKSYYFSLANKFFDYLHHSLPVITMAFPQYESIIDHWQCGWLLSDLSSESIVGVLRNIDRNEILQKSKNSQAAAQYFDWRKEVVYLKEQYAF